MLKFCCFYTFRDSFQFGQPSFDLYWTFEQLLGEPSVWFGFLVLSAVSLIPDMAFMTAARYFYQTNTQFAQVSWLLNHCIPYLILF